MKRWDGFQTDSVVTGNRWRTFGWFRFFRGLTSGHDWLLATSTMSHRPDCDAAHVLAAVLQQVADETTNQLGGRALLAHDAHDQCFRVRVPVNVDGTG